MSITRLSSTAIGHGAGIGLLAATSFLAAGCMTGPDYARQDTDVPEQWSSERAGGEVDKPAELATWWTLLNDPLLDDLIERTVANNYSIRIAQARVREARAARGVVRAGLWPAISAGGSYTENQVVEPEQPESPPMTFGLTVTPDGFSRSVTTRRGDLTTTTTTTGQDSTTSYSYTPGSTPEEFDRTSSLYQAGFDASWEIDVFGGTRRTVEAANAEIDATEEEQRDVLVSLIAEVALNYIQLRASQTRLNITEKNIESQAKTVELTRARFDAGLNSELDTVQARAQMASTKSQVPLLTTQIDQSIHRLSVLVGEDPGALKAMLRPQAALPGVPEEVPVGLPSDLLRRRPDIRSAERQLAAATARIGAATADLFPKFYLTGSIAGQSTELGNIARGANQIWSIGPSIQWPIFQGGRILANIEVQNAREEQALLAYEQSILLALEDVENGLVSFAQEQDRRQLLQDAVAANANAVQLANERYIRGLEGFLNVLQAQQQLFISEDALVQSEQFVLTDLISLYKALGGGWDPEALEVKTETDQS